MAHESEPDQQLNLAVIEPHTVRNDLNGTWIGLGAAIDWIAMRGRTLTGAQYTIREAEALEALVATLADMPPVVAQSLATGIYEERPGERVPIPAGLWSLTATSDATDANQRYRLIPMDDLSDMGGAIVGFRDSGYQRVLVRSYFILDGWSEQSFGIQPSAPRRLIASAEIRRLVEAAIAAIPQDLFPPTQRETAFLVRSIRPEAQRDLIRDHTRKILADTKPGPRGSRIRDRATRMEKLGEEFRAAQLPN